MEKELNKKMKENNYDIAISNHQDVVMDNEITRSTSGFTGTEPGNHRWSIKRSLVLPWGGPIGR